MSVICVIISNFRSKSSQDKRAFPRCPKTALRHKTLSKQCLLEPGLLASENHHLSHQVPRPEEKQHIPDLVQVQASSSPVHGQITPCSYWYLSLCPTAASQQLSKAFPRASVTQPSGCELSTPLPTAPLLQKWVECK